MSSHRPTKPMTVASFFAGIGGFDLGLERAGMDVVFQCEIDAFCQSVLKSHWPDVPLHGDIKTLTADVIPQADIWAGGFPCQDVSLANQGKRKGLAGERSGLFHAYAKLVEQKKPDWIILENVPGLLNSNKGEDFRTVITTMVELGYGVAWRILDAKYFGTPQRRRRVYVVGSLGTDLATRVLFEPDADSVVHRAALGARDLDATRVLESSSAPAAISIQHAAIGRKHEAGPGAKGFRYDGETYTLDSRGSADAICTPLAPFRVRESSGLPKGLDSKRYRATGNAVCVNVIEWLGKRIQEAEFSRE